MSSLIACPLPSVLYLPLFAHHPSEDASMCCTSLSLISTIDSWFPKDGEPFPPTSILLLSHTAPSNASFYTESNSSSPQQLFLSPPIPYQIYLLNVLNVSNWTSDFPCYLPRMPDRCEGKDRICLRNVFVAVNMGHSCSRTTKETQPVNQENNCYIIIKKLMLR